MIYTNDTKKALKIAYQAHKNQYDKSGLPYIFHPFYVATLMKDEITTIVALLHDVIEDSDYTITDIKQMGFSNEVIKALQLLTHDKDVDYYRYIESIKTNEVAKEVKIADLKHNSDLSRLDTVNESDLNRVEKYKKALKILEG